MLPISGLTADLFQVPGGVQESVQISSFFSGFKGHPQCKMIEANCRIGRNNFSENKVIRTRSYLVYN